MNLNDYEYSLTTEAPNKIIISGRSLTAFRSAIPGFEYQDGYAVAFTKENALRIRKFLTGRPTFITPKDKKILATLAKFPEGEEVDKKTWGISLTDLIQTELTKKFGKIKSQWDLIHYLPLRYIDKSNPQQVKELEIGAWSVVVGTVINEVKYDHMRDLVKIVVEDVSGARISASFFRQKYMAYKFKQDDEVVLYGNYSEYIDHKRNQRLPQITNAKIDKLTDARGELPMIPIYPQKSGDKSYQLQNEIYNLLDQNVWIEDPVPERILKKYNFISRDETYRKLHFPETREDAESARRRLAFDEFIRLQVYFHNQRSKLEQNKSGVKKETRLAHAFIDSLPFEFTGAQKRVTKEIEEDLANSKPMYRLLQGDVGSGKTEISTFAALIAVGSEYQTAFLAPTDILASQLFDRIERDLKKAGISEEVTVALMRGKTGVKEKREKLAALAAGKINILVGTHAIIQKNVVFNKLGLVIIDEQHKFGIEQRSYLRDNNKESSPDMLTMSATPIPRTTAQVIYGDMDISIIDELPAGRTPIETTWDSTPKKAWEKIHEQIQLGHQAYVVASLVEDSEKMEDIESATATYEYLSRREFGGYSVGLLHGKLSGEEKQEVIQAFYDNRIQVLVSTTVVEVGVNVPNATVMTILNANRFGIASLHQIRGRVGRGLARGFCFLVGEASNGEAEERLNALVSSTDGFWLAEKDLEIRGEGTLFGSSQSGMGDNFVGNLRDYRDVLEIARKVAPQAASSKMLLAESELIFNDKKVGS